MLKEGDLDYHPRKDVKPGSKYEYLYSAWYVAGHAYRECMCVI